MKSLNIYIIEKFKINSKTINTEYNLDNIESSNDGKLSDDEMDVLEDFFKNNCNNIEKINKTSRGTFSITFKNNLAYRWHEKCKLSISKPPRSNGGYNITIYKANHSMPYSYGDKKKKKGTNEPLLNNIKEVINTLDKKFLNGDWADSVGAKLKN